MSKPTEKSDSTARTILYLIVIFLVLRACGWH